jgi:CRP/FNR family cyclic AMP-dependent transcriptional regulator
VDLSLYVKGVEKVTLQAGEQLFAKGDHGDVMYLVDDGEVELRYAPGRVARVGPGESFGEMSLLDRTDRSADCLAVTDSSLYPISRSLFMILVGDTPYFALEIMRSMSRRLRAVGDLEASQAVD